MTRYAAGRRTSCRTCAISAPRCEAPRLACFLHSRCRARGAPTLCFITLQRLRPRHAPHPRLPPCQVDAGRADSSWEGWEENAYARIHKGNQRCGQPPYNSSRATARPPRPLIHRPFPLRRLFTHRTDPLPPPAPRYDQLFVSGGVRVLRSSVPEERFQQGAGWVYASDHLPIVADLQLPAPRAAGAVARWRGAAAAAGGLASALVVIVCVSLLRGRK